MSKNVGKQDSILFISFTKQQKENMIAEIQRFFYEERIREKYKLIRGVFK